MEYQNSRPTCSTQGKWTGVPPVCRIVQCSKPPPIAFGYIDGEKYSYKSSIHFICNRGWKLIGEKTLKCESTGKWSAPFPTCVGTLCPQPAAIENGYVSSSNFSNGAIITYNCTKGHILVGIDKHKCQNDNTWSGKPPVCKPVICETPKTITNGKLEGNVYEYGHSITYTCNRGYELHGSSVLTCTEDKSWSSDYPVCEQISCPLPDPLLHGEVLVHSFSQGAIGRDVQLWPVIGQRGDITVDGKAMLDASRSNLFHLGDKVMYRCTKGYKLQGNGTRVCLENGTWSNEIPRCKAISCNAPENLVMGDMVVDSYMYMSEINYKCDIGYKLKGASIRKCQANATWSYGNPTCQPIVCPVIQNIPHGNVKWNSLRYGASATYECAPGYKMVGESVRLCELSGKWSGDEPHCISRECKTPLPPENGWVEAENLIVGSTATYHCNNGYELEGSMTRSCLINETWSLEIPFCQIVSCMPPPEIDHGRVEGKNFTFGSSIQYFCDFGYQLEGQSTLMCLAEKMWSGPVPQCAPLPCPRPVQPTHGTVMYRALVVDSTVHFGCKEGYELIGSPSSNCLTNQTWSSHPPVCKLITCPPLKGLKHGKIIGSNSTYGSKVEFKCNSKYKIDAEESITCLATKLWSRSLPKCKRYICDTPVEIQNANIPVGPYSVGHFIDYTCYKGYELVGNATILCDSNGQWQGHLPKCKPVECGSPPEVKHSQIITEGGWILDGNVTYTCDFGYQLKGAVSK